ncbi:sorting nexin-25 [Heptranchias perlo]|uniref:sorting nexin-25 n=1 Tax=Heptranchias perlo TaxID=212740 RepID=UPI00355A94AF
MFFKVMLFGLLFAAAAASRIAQDTSSLSLLVLGGLWWLLAPPVGEGNLDERDRGNQQLPEKTEDAAEINQPNNHVDATDGKEHSSTVLDPSLRQSLRKVFDCSYSQFILLWYNPPEPTEDQPLYRVLLDEFNTTVDHAVKKIRNLDLISIESGLIRILTVHLRTAKKEKREKIFQTRDEEMCFLRSTSEALICNLLPGSLWSVNCYRQLIKEVVALKGTYQHRLN